MEWRGSPFPVDPANPCGSGLEGGISHAPSMTLTYLFFHSPFWASFFIFFFIYLIPFFGFLFLQCKYTFRSLKKKKKQQPTSNQPTLLAPPLIMNYRSLFSMSHPLACWECSSYRSSKIKTVETRLEDEVRWRNPHCYSTLLNEVMLKIGLSTKHCQYQDSYHC